MNETAPEQKRKPLFPILAILLIVSIIGIGVYLFQKKILTIRNVNHPFPTAVLTPLPTKIIPSVSPEMAACTPENLSAHVTFEGAAGSIYGTFTITNTASEACGISTGSFVSVNYDTVTVRNINVDHNGIAGNTILELAPNHAVTAKIQLQNGPQCSTGTHQIPVTYTYAVSDKETVKFSDEAGKHEFSMQVCDSPTDLTTVTVTSLTSKQ